VILYDLGERVVRITGKNWSIVKKLPIAFKRPPHRQLQVAPKRDGDTKQILDFANITNESDQLLFLCWLVSIRNAPELENYAKRAPKA